MRWRPWVPACLAWGCVAALCGSRGLCPAPNASRPEPDPFPVDVIQENYVRNVKNCIFSVVYPTPFKSRVRLVAVSKEVIENILDLDISVKGSSDFLEFVSGGKVIFGSVPLAHRNGDGRAVLRSSVREFLCSEAMHYLGIPTSRAASLVVSDDDVWRDQFYNGNIKKERGVCNTDNFSLLSITIDYGPFGFMDSYDPDFVPNTSDDERRYKIGNQASVGQFNLSKLLQALKPLLDPRQKQLASQILKGYGEHYYSRFTELFKTKLGLLGENENDNYLIAFLLKIMEDTKADFTMTFRELSEITADQLKELHIPEEFWALQDLGKHELFSEWVTMYLLRLNSNNRDSDAKRRTRMATYEVLRIKKCITTMVASADYVGIDNSASHIQLCITLSH
ncbi:hypothetical protein DUI87_18043 [Hirundo rustica rustica]|uniref:Selenoprotein O n=1 Tax=Hirundo rustica rustica TaxID=333673 RepID=A0A3M0JVK9_HIRRU|nr:hypothetical protein DUI87_18043 [Hirundo rustica rustica]